MSDYEMGYADGESSATADLNFLLYDTLNLPDPKDDESEFDTVRGLVERIATLEAAARWIPCSERLPGVYEFVTARNSHYKIAQVSPATYDHVHSVWKDIQDVRVDGTWEDLPCVTHWMPLPSPPQEQLG